MKARAANLDSRRDAISRRVVYRSNGLTRCWGWWGNSSRTVERVERLHLQTPESGLIVPHIRRFEVSASRDVSRLAGENEKLRRQSPCIHEVRRFSLTSRLLLHTLPFIAIEWNLSSVEKEQSPMRLLFADRYSSIVILQLRTYVTR